MSRPVIRNEWAAWAVDTLERTARTFLQAFLGVATVNGVADYIGKVPDTNLSLGAMLASAAIAGVWAVLTAWAAKPVGASSSASFLSPTIVVDDAGEPIELDHGVRADDTATSPPGSRTLSIAGGIGGVGSDDAAAAAARQRTLFERIDSLLSRADELAGRVAALEVAVDPPPPAPLSFAERRTKALLAILENEDQDAERRIDAAKALTDY